MASLEWHATDAGDVTLVELLVTSDAPTRVRIENCLDGPVWPPRRRGLPADGWEEGGFEGVVHGRLVLGYASPAETRDPPARLRTSTTLDETGSSNGGDGSSATARELVRALGDPAPPRDAVGPQRATATNDWEEGDADELSAIEETAVIASDPAPPAELAEWLAGVEQRLDAARRLAAVSSVEEATAAVEAVGGPSDVSALRDRLAADRQALARVGNQCEALAGHTEAVEIPVEALTRLA